MPNTSGTSGSEGAGLRRLARGFLIAVSVLNGISGLICGLLFVVRPDGSAIQAGALLPVIRQLPLSGIFFRDFFWIGIAMLLALGVPNTAAAAMLIRRSKTQYNVTLWAGALLLAWTGFELIFMFNVPAVGYFVVGTLSVVCSVFLKSRRPEECLRALRQSSRRKPRFLRDPARPRMKAKRTTSGRR